MGWEYFRSVYSSIDLLLLTLKQMGQSITHLLRINLPCEEHCHARSIHSLDFHHVKGSPGVGIVTVWHALMVLLPRNATFDLSMSSCIRLQSMHGIGFGVGLHCVEREQPHFLVLVHWRSRSFPINNLALEMEFKMGLCRAFKFASQPCSRVVETAL